MNYATAEGQAWLRYWVGIMPDSLLARFLRDDVAPPPVQKVSESFSEFQSNGHQPKQEARQGQRQPPVARRERAQQRARGEGQERRHRRPPTLEKAESKREAKVARDIERVTRLPVSDWAKQIVGDPRIQSITLRDILDGIEDYFEIFGQLKKVNPAAYRYFSRVGAPIIFRNTMIWRDHMLSLRAGNPELLPSYFGAFFAQTRDEYREHIESDEGSFLEFQMFEKPRNHGTVAALGSTVFAHHLVSLKRNAFSKQELRRLPHVAHNWMAWWYVGVAPDGQVRALPHRMSRYQPLPRGGGVHHSSFQIPPGLYDFGKELKYDHEPTATVDHSPHAYVRFMFNAVVAFTASAVSGVQVTVKKGKRRARFGVPVSALRGFFADRDLADGRSRRRAILHLRLGHDRHMADGRIIQVGEHLSGERFFSWRGYEITVGVPGIHYPSPESYAAPILIAGDPDAPLPDDVDRDDLVPVQKVADTMGGLMQSRERAPIRRGQPVRRFLADHFPPPEVGTQED